MTSIQITPMDVNCPVCAARAGQSCQAVDGFVSPAHASRQIAAVAALATGEHAPTRDIPPAEPADLQANKCGCAPAFPGDAPNHSRYCTRVTSPVEGGA